MEDFQQVLDKIQDLNNRKLLLQVHKKILSAGKDVEYRVFPIYIRYTKGDSNIAILYYEKSNFLDLGLNINKDAINSKFKDAVYMKYPDINYSIKINKIKDLDNKVINFLKDHVGS